jgi:hypothetical protein
MEERFEQWHAISQIGLEIGESPAREHAWASFETVSWLLGCRHVPRRKVPSLPGEGWWNT